MAKRKGEGKKAADDEPTLGPGRHSSWKGVKLKFLEGLVGEFNDCSDSGTFYREAATRFLDTFGYDEDFRKVSDPNVPVESLKAEPLDTIEDAKERETEGARRADLVSGLRGTLGNYFRYRKNKKRSSRTVIHDLIDGLIEALRLRPPRKQTAINRYYEQFWEKLKAAFDTHWFSLSPEKQVDARKMTERNQWVKNCYEDEPGSVKERIMSLIEEEHADAMKDWEDRLKSVDGTAGSEEAWKLSEELIPAIADALAEWLDAYVMIQVVRPKRDNSGEMEVGGAQSDVLLGNTKNLVAESDAAGWAAWVKVLEAYGKEYFSYARKCTQTVFGGTKNDDKNGIQEESGVASGEVSSSSKTVEMEAEPSEKRGPVDSNPSIRNSGPDTACSIASTTPGLTMTVSSVVATPQVAHNGSTATTLSGIDITPASPLAQETVTLSPLHHVPSTDRAAPKASPAMTGPTGDTNDFSCPYLPSSDPPLGNLTSQLDLQSYLRASEPTTGQLDTHRLPPVDTTSFRSSSNQPLVSGDYGGPYHAGVSHGRDLSSDGYGGGASNSSLAYTMDGGVTYFLNSGAMHREPSAYPYEIPTTPYPFQPNEFHFQPTTVDSYGVTCPPFEVPHHHMGERGSATSSAIVPVNLPAGSSLFVPANSPAGPPSPPAPVCCAPVDPMVTQVAGGTPPPVLPAPGVALGDHGGSVPRGAAMEISAPTEAADGSKRKRKVTKPSNGKTKEKEKGNMGKASGGKAASNTIEPLEDAGKPARMSMRKRDILTAQTNSVTEPVTKKHRGARYAYVPIEGAEEAVG